MTREVLGCGPPFRAPTPHLPAILAAQFGSARLKACALRFGRDHARAYVNPIDDSPFLEDEHGNQYLNFLNGLDALVVGAPVADTSEALELAYVAHLAAVCGIDTHVLKSGELRRLEDLIGETILPGDLASRGREQVGVGEQLAGSKPGHGFSRRDMEHVFSSIFLGVASTGNVEAGASKMAKGTHERGRRVA